MPGMSQHPSSDQLQLVIDLTAGMGLKATQGDEEGDLIPYFFGYQMVFFPAKAIPKI